MKLKSIKFIMIFCLLISTVNNASASNSKSLDTANSNCYKHETDKEELKNNPGVYYFRSALCRFDSITNPDGFNRVIALLKKSADNKFMLSNFALGLLFQEKYKYGITYFGVPGKADDIVNAINYYKIAAEAGSSTAENNLGIIYLNELNLSVRNKTTNVDVKNTENDLIKLPNAQLAVEWLDLAAKHGNPAAQGTMADLYKQGVGVPQDFVLAYVWDSIGITSQYNFNNKLGDKILDIVLEASKKSRDESYSKLTELQKNEANKLSNEYSKKYLIKPNEFEALCRDVQTVLLNTTIKQLISN